MIETSIFKYCTELCNELLEKPCVIVSLIPKSNCNRTL